jgi:hypothetical protein
MKIYYSGDLPWEGSGNERIRIKGDLTVPVEIKVYGYAEGDATVTYSYAGIDPCPPDLDTGCAPCAEEHECAAPLLPVCDGRTQRRCAAFEEEETSFYLVCPGGMGAEVFDYGLPTFAESGSHFQLCWSHAPEGLLDYRVQVDAAFFLVGPLVQHFVCTLGVLCNFTLNGTGLSQTNQLLVIADSECGDESPLVAWWVGSEIPNAAYSTWIQNWTQRADYTVDGIPERPPDGTRDGIAAKLLDLEENRPDTTAFAPTLSFYDFGIPVANGYGTRSSDRRGIAGTHYRLCWAHEPSQLSDFKFEVDRDAELVGPYIQDFLCSLGLNCTFTLEGSSLASTNKLVLLHEGECGDVDPKVANWVGAVNPVNVSSLLTGVSPLSTARRRTGTGHDGFYTPGWYLAAEREHIPGFYDFGLPIVLSGAYVSEGKTTFQSSAGDYFKLCWGHDPDSLQQYRFQVDVDATLAGPKVGNVECTLGVHCTVEIETVGMYSSNAVVVLEEGECGDADATLANWMDAENPIHLNGEGSYAEVWGGLPPRPALGGPFRISGVPDSANANQTFFLDGDVEFASGFIWDDSASPYASPPPHSRVLARLAPTRRGRSCSFAMDYPRPHPWTSRARRGSP